MKARKLRKENLTDSMRLNRERMAKKALISKESKFSDEEEDRETESENAAGMQNRGNASGSNNERESLINFLDGQAFVEKRAPALRSARTKDRKYDWELSDEEQIDEEGTHSSVISSVSSSRISTKSLSGMKLELDEKKKTIAALKRALEKTRQEKQDLQRTSKDETSSALKQQRNEHEKAVARHLAFIDKLLADKKDLSAKVEEISSRLNKSEDDMARTLRQLQEKHSREIARAKETMAQADAAKRAKWQKEKTKELKELTIKGLEPEMQNILAKQKEDLRMLEDNFRGEARELREKFLSEKDEAMKVLRERHEEEIEEIKAKEERTYAGKLRFLEERHQNEVRAQRLRLEDEFESIKKRYKEEMLEKASAISKHREMELLQEKRRLEDELERTGKKHELEKERWQAQLVKKVEEKAHAAEKGMREKLIAQRDKQIDAVINKLIAEQEGKLAELAAVKNREVDQAKYDAEEPIQEAREKAEHWHSKYLQLKKEQSSEKETYSSAEARVRDLERQAQKREEKILGLNSKIASVNDLLAEREQEVRNEYAEKQAANIRRHAELQEKITDMQSQLAREANLKKQMETSLRAQFEDETAEIHQRVRQAITKKDEAIESLQEQLEELQERNESLAEIVERQREEFIG